MILVPRAHRRLGDLDGEAREPRRAAPAHRAADRHRRLRRRRADRARRPRRRAPREPGAGDERRRPRPAAAEGQPDAEPDDRPRDRGRGPPGGSRRRRGEAGHRAGDGRPERQGSLARGNALPPRRADRARGPRGPGRQRRGQDPGRGRPPRAGGRPDGRVRGGARGGQPLLARPRSRGRLLQPDRRHVRLRAAPERESDHEPRGPDGAEARLRAGPGDAPRQGHSRGPRAGRGRLHPVGPRPPPRPRPRRRDRPGARVGAKPAGRSHRGLRRRGPVARRLVPGRRGGLPLARGHGDQEGDHGRRPEALEARLRGRQRGQHLLPPERPVDHLHARRSSARPT